MVEELKQRLRDMGTLSDSRTPQDALEYIEQLEYNNKPDELECVAYIDADGDLFFKNGGYIDMVDQIAESSDHFNTSHAVRKFYKGDKLEIEF